MVRLFLAQINTTVGDINGNCQKIVETIGRVPKGSLLLFPELTITGYPPEDFLLLDEFVQRALNALDVIIAASKGVTVVVGLPRAATGEKKLYNSAAVIDDCQLLGFQDKALLPTYDVFDEQRYFSPGVATTLFSVAGRKIGITICEDIWGHADLVKETTYSHDPIADLAALKPDLVLNLSASPFTPNKFPRRQLAAAETARRLSCPVCLTNQVGGNDSLIFDGKSFAVDAKGELMAIGCAFAEDLVEVPFEQIVTPSFDPDEELFAALVLGVCDYFGKQGFAKACFGLSGGIDSALVACIAKEALGADHVLAVAMPSRYSSQESLIDARCLVDNLGLSLKEIAIEGPFQAYLDLLAPHFAGYRPDVTEENLQARVRAMILMALSNKLGLIVLSTGNKSEQAMGYSTLYGDLSGGLAVISDLTKEEVYRLARFVNRHGEVIPQRIIDKPPSAELRPNQLDSDSLPDYAIIDAVLRLYVEEHKSAEEIVAATNYDLALVKDLIRRIHRSEYKRRQSPPGLRVSEKSFTVGRKFPIVQKWC